jgi:hypothetical protein
MIYAWLLVGSFIAVSGGLLIASIYGHHELEDLRGVPRGNSLPEAGSSEALEVGTQSTNARASAPTKGRL